MHCFHLSMETWSGVLCSETLIRRIWEDLFLKVSRIICSIRQDQTWRSKNFVSSPSISASVNYNDKRKRKDWRYRTHKKDLLNPDENKFDYKKTCLWKKVLRTTQIPSIHEMGEMKRAQELRVDEVSVLKWGENHETVQQLTSQLQQMQEQMNFMNDSGEFHEVEWDYSGRLSYVSSQPVMIPSSRSLLSRDTRFAAWHMESIWITRNRLWISIFYVRFTQRSSSKNSIWPRAKKPWSSPWSRKDEDCSHKWKWQNQCEIPMSTFATKPLTTSSTILVELPHNFTVGQ